MAEEAELSALGNRRLCLFRVFDVGGGGLVAGLARDPDVIAFLFAGCDRIVTSGTGISASIDYPKIGILLRRGGAVMSVEAKIRGHKKIMDQGINGNNDRQRNQEMAYLLGEALP
jgi:hypothetical protein